MKLIHNLFKNICLFSTAVIFRSVMLVPSTVLNLLTTPNELRCK
jgi:hypothetical protein